MGFAPCGSLEARREGGIRSEVGGAFWAGEGRVDSSGSVEFEDESEVVEAKSLTSPGGPS